MSETITHTMAGMQNARIAASGRWEDGTRKHGRPLTDTEYANVRIAQAVFEARERVERAMYSDASDDEIVRCLYAFLVMRAASQGRVIAI